MCVIDVRIFHIHLIMCQIVECLIGYEFNFKSNAMIYHITFKNMKLAEFFICSEPCLPMLLFGWREFAHMYSTLVEAEVTTG